MNNHVKAEIQFWWDAEDNSIHVTTRPGSTPEPLHTTFPNNPESERWHRSMFAWLTKVLQAEGKPAPTLKDIHRA